MNKLAKKRILNDLKELQKEIKNSNFVINELKESKEIQKCQVVLKGPIDTPYENGLFLLEITFSDNYPFKAPNVYFKTPFLHPNVANNGRICIDILQDNWSSVYTLISIMLSISALLNNPNTEEPLNIEISDLYNKNKKKYNETVKDFVRNNCYIEKKIDFFI
jgi:ubiquitin-protein ligase